MANKRRQPAAQSPSPAPHQQSDLVVGVHDLAGVRTVVVVGWSGQALVREGREAGVKVSSTRRHPSERGWTFQPVKEGVLTCFSDLLNSPGLLNRDQLDGATLTVELPAGMGSRISVQTRSGR